MSLDYVWSWANSPEKPFVFNSQNLDSGNDIIVNDESSSNSSYIIGQFNNQITFNSTTFTSNSISDMFLINVNSEGNIIWGVQSKCLTPSSSCVGNKITADFGNQYIYIIGTYKGQVEFDNTITLNSTNETVFFAKYDTFGTLIWINDGIINTGIDTKANGLSIVYQNSSSNLYLCGSFLGTLTINSLSLTSSNLNGFVASIDESTGLTTNWLISPDLDVLSEAVINDITTLGNNLYIVGEFIGTVTFGSTELTSSVFSAFVSQIDSSLGTWIWTNKPNSSTDVSGKSITVSQNNIYIIGNFDSDITVGSKTIYNFGRTCYVAQIDIGGIWKDIINVVGLSDGYDLVYREINGDPYIIITGSYINTITLGTTELTTSTFDTIFVAFINQQVNSLEWSFTIDTIGTNKNIGKSIDADDDSIYITGNYIEKITSITNNAVTFGNYTLTNYGDSNIYYAKLGTPAQILLSIDTINNLATIFIDPEFNKCSAFPPDITSERFKVDNNGQAVFTFTLNQATNILYNSFLVENLDEVQKNIPDDYVFSGTLISNCNQLVSNKFIDRLVLNFFDKFASVQLWNNVNILFGTNSTTITNGPVYNNQCPTFLSTKLYGLTWNNFANLIVNEGIKVEFNTESEYLFFGAINTNIVCCEGPLPQINNSLTWEWAYNPITTIDPNNDLLNDIIYTTNGNIYMLIGFENTTTFGSITFTVDPNNTEMAILRLNKEGNIIWGKQSNIVSGSLCVGNKITFDADDNVYVIGVYDGSVNFDSFTITTITQALFITKYDKDGNVLWVNSSTSDDITNGTSIFANSFTNMYICGNYLGTMTLNSQTIINSSSNQQGFIGNLDPITGNCLWLVTLTNDTVNSNSSLLDVYSYGFNNNVAIVVGFFADEISAGSFTLTTSSTANTFVVRINNTGMIDWVLQADSINDNVPSSIFIKDGSNIFITGIFSDTVIFGTYTLTGISGENLFVAKINDLTVNGDWSNVIQSISSNDNQSNMIIGNSDNIAICGSFIESITLGSITLTTDLGTRSSFIAYLEIFTLDWIEAVKPVSNFANTCQAIAMETNNKNIYTVGYFAGGNTLPNTDAIQFGIYDLTNYGDFNIFYAKLITPTSIKLTINTENKMAVLTINKDLNLCKNALPDTILAQTFEQINSENTIILMTFTLDELSSNLLYNKIFSIENINLPNNYVISGDVLNNCTDNLDYQNISNTIVNKLIVNLFNTNTNNDICNQLNMSFGTKLNTLGDNLITNQICYPFLSITLDDINLNTLVNSLTNDGFKLEFNTSMTDYKFGASNAYTTCCTTTYETNLVEYYWEWVNNPLQSENNLSPNNEGLAVAVDGNKFVYITGHFNNTLTIGNITLTQDPNGDYNMFIIKLDTNGNVIFGIQTYSDNINVNCSGIDLVVDNSGLYVTGNFNGPINLGDSTLTSITTLNETNAVFVAKYSLDGLLQWVNTSTMNVNTLVKGIHKTESSNIYIIGTYDTSLQFDSFTLTPTFNGFGNLFIAEFDNTNGSCNNLYSPENLDNSSRTIGNNIFIFENNVYITGNISGNVSLGTITMNLTINNMFVAKYDSALNINWIKLAESLDNSSLSLNVIYDSDLDIINIYVVGGYINTTTFINTNTLDNITLPLIGSVNAYVAKLIETVDDNIWTKVLRLNSPTVICSDITAIINEVSGDTVSFYPNKLLFITGFYQTSLTFGQSTLTSSQNTSYVGILDSELNELYALNATSDDNNYSRSLAIDNDLSIYTTGVFEAPFSVITPNQIQFGSINLTAYGGENIYYAKISVPISLYASIDTDESLLTIHVNTKNDYNLCSSLPSQDLLGQIYNGSNVDSQPILTYRLTEKTNVIYNQVLDLNQPNKQKNYKFVGVLENNCINNYVFEEELSKRTISKLIMNMYDTNVNNGLCNDVLLTFGTNVPLSTNKLSNQNCYINLGASILPQLFNSYLTQLTNGISIEFDSTNSNLTFSSYKIQTICCGNIQNTETNQIKYLWEWAKGPELIPDLLNPDNISNSVVVDDDNNVYITGSFSTNITFGGLELTIDGINQTQMFLAKLDKSGNVLWVRQSTSNLNNLTCVGNSLAYNNNYIYLVGTYDKNINLSNTVTLFAILASIFIVKYDTDGNIVWTNNSQNDNDARGIGIYYNSTGNNLYICGSFAGTLTIDTESVSTPETSIYVGKLDPITGNCLWLRQSLNNMTTINALKLHTDNSNHVYVIGNYVGTITFASTITTETLNSNRHTLFVAKIDYLGNWLWAISPTYTLLDPVNASATGYGIVSDDVNIYITGSYSNKVSFNTITLSSSFNNNCFVAQLLDNQSSGVWIDAIDVNGESVGYDIKKDTEKLYISGSFRNLATFGNISLTSLNDNTFVGIINLFDTSNLIFNNVLTPVSDYINEGYALINNNTNIYVTGYFTGGLTLPTSNAITFGQFNLTNYGNSNFYISKLALPLQIHLNIDTDESLATFFYNPAGSTCQSFPIDDSHATSIFEIQNTNGFPIFTFTLEEQTNIIYNPTLDLTLYNLENNYNYVGQLLFNCSDNSIFNIIPSTAIVNNLVLNLFNLNDNLIGCSTVTLSFGTSSTLLSSNEISNVICYPYLSSNIFNSTFGDFINLLINNGFSLNMNTINTGLEFGATKTRVVCCILAGAIINTLNGPKFIEDLRKGDIVFDINNNQIEVLNLMRFNVNNKESKYITIKENSIAYNIPNGDISISYDHFVKINNKLFRVQELLKESFEGIFDIKSRVDYYYTPITSNGEFVMINNIEVGTFEVNYIHDFIKQQKMKGYPVSYSLF